MTGGVVGVPAGQRIGTMTLVRGAIARMRAAGWPLVAFYAVAAATALGQQYFLQASHLSATTESGLNLTYFVYLVAASFWTGLQSAASQRLLLQGLPGLFKLDGRLLESAGLLTLAALALLVLPLSFSLSVADRSDVTQAAWRSIAVGLIYLVTLYVFIRLLLWPLGALTGQVRVTPARSWRLMRKATRGYVLANLLAALPLVIVIYGGMFAHGIQNIATARSDPAYLAATTLVGILFSVVSQAITTTLYALRVEAPSSVADVFD